VSERGRCALTASLRPELQAALIAGRHRDVRPGEARRFFGWNFVASRTLRIAGPPAQLLWRAPDRARDALDPLDFAPEWRPLATRPGFADAARALLEQCPGMRRAWLTEEVLLEDGAEVSSHAHVSFDSADRRWPRQAADGLIALRRREWSPFGVGRADSVVFGRQNATELYRRHPRGGSSVTATTHATGRRPKRRALAALLLVSGLNPSEPTGGAASGIEGEVNG